MQRSKPVSELELIALETIFSIKDSLKQRKLCREDDANKLARELSRFLALKAHERDF